MIFRFFLTVFFTLILASCATSQQNEVTLSDYAASAAVYMPLQVGAKWTYAVDYLGSMGEISIEITTKSKEWFIDSQSNRLMVDRRGIRDDKRYLLMFPLQEKKSWTAITAPGKTEQRTIVSLHQQVETPAGTFEDAIVVEAISPAGKNMLLKSLTYFVPKKGIVKIETFTVDMTKGKETLQTVTSLKNFIDSAPKN